MFKSLIVCGVTPGTPAANGTNTVPCDFSHLIMLGKIIINDLFYISSLLATVVIVYAAFKLITSGGNTGARDDAKRMLFKVLKGYIVILVAWLLIYTISNALLNPATTYQILGKP